MPDRRADYPYVEGPPESSLEERRSSRAAVLVFVRIEDKPDIVSEELRSRFDELVRVWTDETMLSSSTHLICLHWAYQRVIGLGSAVVPLIMEEVRKGRRHWGWALTAITGENPAEPTESLKAAAEAWILWEKEQQITVERPKFLD